MHMYIRIWVRTACVCVCVCMCVCVCARARAEDEGIVGVLNVNRCLGIVGHSRHAHYPVNPHRAVSVLCVYARAQAHLHIELMPTPKAEALN
jgi:hypothetical protein